MSQKKQRLSNGHDAAHSSTHAERCPRMERVLTAVNRVKILSYLPMVPIVSVLIALFIAAPAQRAQTREEMGALKVQVATLQAQATITEQKAAEAERRFNELSLQFARLQTKIDTAQWVLAALASAVFGQIGLSIFQQRVQARARDNAA